MSFNSNNKMSQSHVPVESPEGLLSTLQQSLAACTTESGPALHLAWSALRSLTPVGPVPLTTEFCQKIHACCADRLVALEKEPIKQTALGSSFVLLVEAFSTILHFADRSEPDPAVPLKDSALQALAKTTFRDYVKCLSNALFLADFLRALGDAIAKSVKGEAEETENDSNNNDSLESVLSDYVQIMLNTVKRFEPAAREEARPAVEYIWATLLMQVVPVYCYIAKNCLPAYLGFCSPDYIVSMANWLAEYAEKIIKMKDKEGSACVQCCGKHCAMIYNLADVEVKKRLFPVLEKALGNELIFYNIALYLQHSEDESADPDLMKKYEAIVSRLADKLTEILKDIRTSGKEEDQVKCMNIANVYLAGLKFFTGGKLDPAATPGKKVVAAIKALRLFPMKLKTSVPSAELLRNMIDLHSRLSGGLDFKDYYPYIRLCKQFIQHKKFLLVAALLIDEYSTLEPPADLQTDVSWLRSRVLVLFRDRGHSSQNPPDGRPVHPLLCIHETQLT